MRRRLGAFLPVEVYALALAESGEVIRYDGLDQPEAFGVVGVDADDQEAGSGGECASARGCEGDDAAGLGPFGPCAENEAFRRMRLVG